MVIFLVAVIDNHYQSIHILEQDGFSLFLDRDRILDSNLGVLDNNGGITHYFPNLVKRHSA